MPKTSTVESREFSLDDWIESGTVAQRTVELHNDRAIPDRLAVLDKRRALAAGVAEQIGETSVTDVPEFATIDAQMEALFAQWEASLETWVVRALSNEEIKALRRLHPVPKGPEPLKKNSLPSVKTAHEQRTQEWADAALLVRDESDLHYLTWALLRVETAKGTATCHGEPLTVDGDLNEDFVPAATVAQLKALRSRPGRQNDIARLLEAAVDATKSDVEVPAPFSRRTSETAPS